jgi:hypothetical protein
MRGKKITYSGETRTISEWSQTTGVSRQSISNRLKAGWSIERALTEPRGSRGPQSAVAVRPMHTELKAFTTFREWMEAEHRALHRTIRAFVRDVEDRAAEARHRVDLMVQEQIDWAAREAGRGEVTNFSKLPSDQTLPSAQEMTKLEKFR